MHTSHKILINIFFVMNTHKLHTKKMEINSFSFLKNIKQDGLTSKTSKIFMCEPEMFVAKNISPIFWRRKIVTKKPSSYQKCSL